VQQLLGWRSRSETYVEPARKRGGSPAWVSRVERAISLSHPIHLRPEEAAAEDHYRNRPDHAIHTPPLPQRYAPTNAVNHLRRGGAIWRGLALLPRQT
jgi:hypothetical protein